MDQLLGEEGGGRVRRKLDQFGDLLGLVVGRFNEVSNDLSNILQSMAESRVNMVGLSVRSSGNLETKFAFTKLFS